MQLKIPAKVTRILDTLTVHGYEAYAVGGCIRDAILARTPDDWDITTSARPGQVKELFSRTVDTGLQHGTVTVLVGGEGFEVTTYRIDGEYEDHRHPAEVIYASRLSEDLMRRDFTINAMAYNKESGLVDLFGGMEDLQRKVIRCVGDPVERFTEDALRILRALRFSAQLGFTIEDATMQALQKLAPTLVHVSAERIQVELVKLLLSSNPHYIKIVQEVGILKVVIPQLGDITEQQLEHLRQLPADKRLRLAALLLPMGDEKAAKILRTLKFDNETIHRVKRLIHWYERDIGEDPEGVRRGLNEIGEDLFGDLLIFQEHRHDVEKVRQTWEEVLARGECYQLKQMAISGRDLMDLGIMPGPQIGEYLSLCLEEVLKYPQHNTKEYLSEYISSVTGMSPSLFT